MKPSVVQIAYISDSPNRELDGGIAGTGFFVNNDGYVLTAAHVITETQSQLRASGATTIEFSVGMSIDDLSSPKAEFRGSFTHTKCTIKDIDTNHDVALLELAHNPFAPNFVVGIIINGKFPKLTVAAAKLRQDLPPEGQKVLVSGYPLAIPNLVTQGGMVASETYAPSKEFIHPPGAPAGVTMPEQISVILLDAVVNPGNSGGPVYVPGSDLVIGICEAFKQSPLFTNKSNPVRIGESEFLTENSGLAVVIPIKYAIELLQKNNIHFQSP